MDKIRTGLIRCDTHGSYHAALMPEHDPLALRKHWHICHFNFYDPKKIIVPTVWSFHFRNRFAELDGPEFGIVKGGGDTMAGHTHAICLAQHLFGAGMGSVEYMGQTTLAYMHLDYGGKPDQSEAGVALNCASGGNPHCAYYASASAGEDQITLLPSGILSARIARQKSAGRLERWLRPVSHMGPPYEMMEAVAIAAARLAQKMGRRVHLKDV